MSWTLRRAAPDDADAIARLNCDSARDYRAFAPAGWQPPPLERS